MCPQQCVHTLAKGAAGPSFAWRRCLVGLVPVLRLSRCERVETRKRATKLEEDQPDELLNVLCAGRFQGPLSLRGTDVGSRATHRTWRDLGGASR